MLSSKARELLHVASALRQSPCPLAKQATQPVPGEGNADAALFFIGEAPGRQEDLTGRPFVGTAGKVLTNLLASIGVAREDVFITSIEKFRPPNNRDPRPAEIMACFPFLEQQLSIIQPKIIITLGRHAAQRMLEWDTGKTITVPSLEALHGTAITMRRGYMLFPLHHPAAVLYNRSLLDVLRRDIAQLAILLSKLS